MCEFPARSVAFMTSQFTPFGTYTCGVNENIFAASPPYVSPTEIKSASKLTAPTVGKLVSWQQTNLALCMTANSLNFKMIVGLLLAVEGSDVGGFCAKAHAIKIR